MKKIGILFFVLVSFLSAGLINGVAVVVNEKAITLNELQNKIDSLNVSKEIAIGLLIEEKLYEDEIRKQGISLGIFEIDDHIKQIAINNNMELDVFKNAVTSQYGSLDKYKEEIRKNLLHSKLVNKIARGNLTIASDDDLKLHYQNNIDKFTFASSVDLIEYSSTSTDALKQPKVSKGISKKNITLDMTNINPELRYMVLGLKEGEISPILNANNGYVRLEVVRKNNQQTIPFENVKDAIFQEVMMQREQSYLKEYFDKLKISADVVVLR